MKLIFSRKGFDSASGGVASPIFESGQMLSLPIPATSSPITYEMLASGMGPVGQIVEQLTGGRIGGRHGAHLDPDLDPKSLSRPAGWRPLFGQVDAAQTHLAKQGVQCGDLFLFFGWFRQVKKGADGRLRFDPTDPGRHILWGWLQVGAIVPVNKVDRSLMGWATYHPHMHQAPNPSNTLYVAAERLELAGKVLPGVPGAGTFPALREELVLTDPASRLRSIWRVPAWMYPASPDHALSYHTRLNRWEKADGYTRLRTVGRGQEFVLDCHRYPHAPHWVQRLFSGLSQLNEEEQLAALRNMELMDGKCPRYMVESMR